MSYTIARQIALEVLNRTENAPLSFCLESTFQKYESNAQNSPTTQDKAYVTQLVYGVLRQKLRLDSISLCFIKQPEKLSLTIKNILRIALYEIFFLDSVPVRASIDQAVICTKKENQHEAGFVNAVLRQIEREKESFNNDNFSETIKKKFKNKNTFELLCLSQSLPPFLGDIIKKQYGKEFAEEYILSLNFIPDYVYRLNSSKNDWETLREEILKNTEATPVAYSGIKSPHSIENVNVWQKAGLISSQGITSQILIDTMLNFVSINDLKGMWDACCGFGGKTTALLERGVDIAFASDISLSRIEGLNHEIERLALPKPVIENTGIEESTWENMPFILLDMPCSGLGTLKRNPDLRYRISKQSLKDNVILQEKLAKAAWSKLADKGLCCYVTCSLHKEENENIIEKLQSDCHAHLLHQQYIVSDVKGADTLFMALLKKV